MLLDGSVNTLSQVSHEGFAHRRSVVMCSQTICGDVLIVSELHSVRFSKIWICSLSILLAGQPLNWSSGQILGELLLSHYC